VTNPRSSCGRSSRLRPHADRSGQVRTERQPRGGRARPVQGQRRGLPGPGRLGDLPRAVREPGHLSRAPGSRHRRAARRRPHGVRSQRQQEARPAARRRRDPLAGGAPPKLLLHLRMAMSSLLRQPDLVARWQPGDIVAEGSCRSRSSSSCRTGTCLTPTSANRSRGSAAPARSVPPRRPDYRGRWSSTATVGWWRSTASPARRRRRRRRSRRWRSPCSRVPPPAVGPPGRALPGVRRVRPGTARRPLARPRPAAAGGARRGQRQQGRDRALPLAAVATAILEAVTAGDRRLRRELGKVLVLGAAEAGKSTLIRALCPGALNLAVNAAPWPWITPPCPATNDAVAVGVPVSPLPTGPGSVGVGARCAVWVHRAGAPFDPSTTSLVARLIGSAGPYLVYVNHHRASTATAGRRRPAWRPRKRCWKVIYSTGTEVSVIWWRRSGAACAARVAS